MATINIGRSSSRCLGCNKGADPNEHGHQIILGYMDRGEPGCGEPWTAVRIDYLPANVGFVFENLRGLPLEAPGYPQWATYPPE